jgi:hypothetical protein
MTSPSVRPNVPGPTLDLCMIVESPPDPNWPGMGESALRLFERISSRRQVERQVIWLEAALGRPGQVIAMAFGAIPTVIGGPAVLVAVRIGVTESVPPVT